MTQPTDPDLDPEVRDRVAEARDSAAESRDRDSESRDRDSESRDRDAASGGDVELRDGVGGTDAESRDRDAEARDRDAEVRDRDAEVRDLALGGVGLPAVIHSTPSSDREASRSDRQRAALDRAASARDRLASSFDELTGAYRRTPGMVEARREVARMRRVGHSLSFVFVDVDGLKAVNDVHGHLAGDMLLREVGRQIRLVLRDYDLLVRYGGDEFLCLLSDTGALDAGRRFELVNAVLATFEIHGSISVGVAELQPTDTVEDVLARADAAMYEGRRQRGHYGS